MATRGSAFKRESTVVHGLITPDESMTSTIHPKQETDLDSMSFPNQLQAKVQDDPFRSHHGLPFENHSFASGVSEHQRRSASVSLRSSYPPPPQHRTRDSLPPATMSAAPTKEGAGIRAVGQSVRLCVNAVEEMRKLGIPGIDQSIPELVMVGDQSAGKSSLMSGIAEVNLPTGQSMCTQCPTNIKTSNGKQWTCKVSLQEQYTFIPGKYQKVNNQEFPNWRPKELIETTEFQTINKESDLEEVLRWAQIALLNPSQDYKNFIPGSKGYITGHQIRENDPNHKEEARFSPNVILVEITGPGLPDLSFFDLPGLFQTAEDPELQYLVKVFKTLTIKYIKHEKALIICAITMANDPGLSATKAVIAQCNADHRCIGVLTMPDRLSSDDYDNILNQRTYVLPHGYFITKRPGKDSGRLRGPDYHTLAHQEEQHFFDTDDKWRVGGEWAKFRHRCGTATISKYISSEFAKLILQSIPDLEQKIKALATNVERQLSRLPEESQDRAQETVSQALFEFSSGVRGLLDGGEMFQLNLHAAWARLCNQFQRAIELMRPGCKVSHPSDERREFILIDDDSDDEGKAAPTRQIIKNSKRPLDSPVTPSKKLKLGIRSSPGRSPLKFEDRPLAFESPQSKKTKNPQGGLSIAFQRLKPDDLGPFYHDYLGSGHGAISIEDIRQSIQSNLRPGRPGSYNEKLKDDFALMSIIPWQYPLQDFLDSTFEILRCHIHAVLSNVLDNYQDTTLYRDSKPILDRFLAQLQEDQQAKAFALYEREKAALFTINTKAFDLNKHEALLHLRATRRNVRLDAYVKKSFPSYSGKLSLEDFKVEQQEKMKDSDLPGEAFDEELEVAAYIRGYYNTARLRFTDSVCADINFILFNNIKNGITHLLPREFGINDGDGEAKCQALLSGSAEIVNRRLSLRLHKEKLAKFQTILSQVRNGVELDENSPSLAIDDDSLISILDDGSTPRQNSDDRGLVGSFAPAADVNMG